MLQSLAKPSSASAGWYFICFFFLNLLRKDYDYPNYIYFFERHKTTKQISLTNFPSTNSALEVSPQLKKSSYQALHGSTPQITHENTIKYNAYTWCFSHPKYHYTAKYYEKSLKKNKKTKTYQETPFYWEVTQTAPPAGGLCPPSASHRGRQWGPAATGRPL